MVVDSCFL